MQTYFSTVLGILTMITLTTNVIEGQIWYLQPEECLAHYQYSINNCWIYE